MKRRKAKPIPYWWLSFADEDGFRGVAIVRARDMVEAVVICHRLGINPGGQVLGWPCPFDKEHTVDAAMTNRLLTKAEVLSMTELDPITPVEATSRGRTQTKIHPAPQGRKPKSSS